MTARISLVAGVMLAITLSVRIVLRISTACPCAVNPDADAEMCQLKLAAPEQHERHQFLEQDLASTKHRAAVRIQTLCDLIDGHIRYVDAVESFEILNQTSPGCLALLRNEFPKLPTEELAEAHVWRHLRQQLPENASPETRRRLEAERQQYLDHRNRAITRKD